MRKNTIVRADVNEKIKQKANEKNFPLEPVPNALTAETIRRGRKGEGLHTTKDKEDLFKQLGI